MFSVCSTEWLPDVLCTIISRDPRYVPFQRSNDINHLGLITWSGLSTCTVSSKCPRCSSIDTPSTPAFFLDAFAIKHTVCHTPPRRENRLSILLHRLVRCLLQNLCQILSELLHSFLHRSPLEYGSHCHWRRDNWLLKPLFDFHSFALHLHRIVLRHRTATGS